LAPSLIFFTIIPFKYIDVRDEEENEEDANEENEYGIIFEEETSYDSNSNESNSPKK
jgi:hypothetical protein